MIGTCFDPIIEETQLHVQGFPDYSTEDVRQCDRGSMEVSKSFCSRYITMSISPPDPCSIPPVSSAGVISSVLRLRPALLRLITQLTHRSLLQPIRLPLHGASLKVVLPALALEHARPAINCSVNLLLRQTHNLLPQLLLLRRDALRIHVRDIHRDVSPLGTAQVGRRVFSEAAGDESARRVLAREDVVAAAGPVDVAAGGDVVDGAVQGHVDGFVGVGAVVGEELGVG